MGPETLHYQCSSYMCIDAHSMFESIIMAYDGCHLIIGISYDQCYVEGIKGYKSPIAWKIKL